jgi:hypothetical protein
LSTYETPLRGLSAARKGRGSKGKGWEVSQKLCEFSARVRDVI